MKHFVTASWMALSVLTLVQPAAAQEPAQPMSRPAIDGIEIVTGLMDFDLSGTGQTIPVAVRFSKALTNNLAVEIGTTMARPEQQFGRSSMTVPEAHLSYAWRLGRVRPYLSGGAGFARFGSALFDDRWRATFSAGGGARVDLSDRLYAIGEMRLRGISRRFSATTAEWLGGIGWSLR